MRDLWTFPLLMYPFLRAIITTESTADAVRHCPDPLAVQRLPGGSVLRPHPWLKGASLPRVTLFPQSSPRPVASWCGGLKACHRARSVVSDSLQPHGLRPTKLPCPWTFPSKNTEGLPFPPPGNLPNPGIELASLAPPHWQADSLPLSQWNTVKHKGLDIFKGLPIGSSNNSCCNCIIVSPSPSCQSSVPTSS